MRGDSPYLCPQCLYKTALGVELTGPPQDRGAKPPSKNLRKAAQRQEKEMAELIGGKRQKGSGAVPSHKSDVRLKGKLRGETKLTTKKAFTLKRAVLDKIRSECVGAERPFVGLRFVNPCTMAVEDEWVIIPLEDWEHAASHHQ